MFATNHKELFRSIVDKQPGMPTVISSVTPVSGGDINEAFIITTNKGSWFAKWNNSQTFPGMFEAEARGLELLRNADEIYIPEVTGYGDFNTVSMLVLEHVKPSGEIKDFWRDFGSRLARLHKNHSSDAFGLDHSNYIGSLVQVNQQHSDWSEFFITCRLEAQLKPARDKNLADTTMIRLFEKLYTRLHDIFPPEKPALLHGDLWGGNYMVSSRGEACLIDPAVYYGHRLMDVAMTKLFGGFAADFYESYNTEYPLEKNWQKSVEIANLYPLLVHLNLFGGSYLSSIKGILKQFS